MKRMNGDDVPGARFAKALRGGGDAAAASGSPAGSLSTAFSRGSSSSAGNGGAVKGCVAVTGAAGFLGQLARAECEEMGLRVRGFDLPRPRCQGGPGLHGSKVAAPSKADVQIDLAKTDPEVLAGHFKGCDYVIHLAADGRPSAKFAEEVLPNNILATYNVLEAAKRAGVRRVIFASSNHTQHGETMGGSSGVDHGRLGQLGGPGSVKLGDPMWRTGPDSFYGVSKLTGEALGYLYARVQSDFEFVALRIGWCLYDSVDHLKGSNLDDYHRAMWLSRRDFKGFLRHAMSCDLSGEPHRKYLVAYAVSRNRGRLFDLKESTRSLGYEPLDGDEVNGSSAAAAPAAAAVVGAAPRPAAAGLGLRKPVSAISIDDDDDPAPVPAGASGSGGGAASGSRATGVAVNWEALAGVARTMRGIYKQGYAFPEWCEQMLRSGELAPLLPEVVCYYREGDSLEEVKVLAEQREPCNIMMRRFYDKERLGNAFGYKVGAYAKSTKDALLPNIAIFCRTPIRQGGAGPGAKTEFVNVINVIGYAFDSPDQPDYQYFLPMELGTPKWRELVSRFKVMWRFVFECARRRGLKRIYIADVGGGAFSDGLNFRGPGYAKLKEASLAPVREEYKDEFEVEQLPRIPDFAFLPQHKGILGESLLVNAWDPWSLVGNGNFGDNSLDGFFGRCTAMGLLCWPRTNPLMKWESVKDD